MTPHLKPGVNDSLQYAFKNIDQAHFCVVYFNGCFAILIGRYILDACFRYHQAVTVVSATRGEWWPWNTIGTEQLKGSLTMGWRGGSCL
ncbi:hypothetical protein HYPSUDRAFT_628875 [Hypholoma sublateritium FD-334 SS-4]|uniref:Uncharacterized protein n=1 Tax=Hypholoma sublateritium (strain FD-334 SS-4) TaxID=945553 RepID=A0A0D2PDJ0_HYPSF|nr:hypothetical protein HYPSUDRAFT_628875 [Hypholoma sublateritium FD-334 SS-4]